MVSALRELRDAQPAGALHHQLRAGRRAVHHRADTGETEDDISHVGDPWLPQDELARVLAGESLLANVLTADDFGVWVTGIAPVCDARGHGRRGGHRRRARRRVARRRRCRATARTRWRPCCRRRPSASAAPRSRPSPTASPGSTTTATCTSASRRSSSAPGAATSKLSLLFCDCDHFKTYNDDLRPQGRRRRPGAHRPHHRGLQPARRPGGALRRRGVRARARRHRRGRGPRRGRAHPRRGRSLQRSPAASP